MKLYNDAVLLLLLLLLLAREPLSRNVGASQTGRDNGLCSAQQWRSLAND